LRCDDDGVADAEIPEVTDFLAEHAPFAAVPRTELERLARRLTIRYARRGTRPMTVGRANDEVFVVRSGAVQITDDNGTLVSRGGEGATFGTTALDGQPSRFDVEAIEDCLLLVLSATVFRELAAAHPVVGDYFSQQRAERLRHALQTMPHAERDSAVLQTRLRDLLRRDPITTTGDATIREAAQLMAREQVSSLLVVDGARLVGIVTDRDLRTRVLAAGLDTSHPVSTVMTTHPVTAGPDDIAMELILEMTSRNIHHVPVVDLDHAATPLGMLTSTDLMRLERANPIHLVGDIAKADDLDTLIGLSQRLPRIIDQLVHEDATADGIGRIVTAVGDAIEQRLIHLAERALGPSPAAYAWVVLGSQARLEQGPGSDQDNALVLSDDTTTADAPWFEALATFVVEGLVACGYPRCPGDIMATNPRWRQPLREWKRTFARWIDEPVPDAILRSAIFFDLRTVHGDDSLVAGLQEQIRLSAPHSGRFLAHLARNAAANEPPLGFFRGFVLERAGEHKDTLDLKRGGFHAVVEVARVHALSRGLPQVSTLSRIAAAAGAGGLSSETAADLHDAFEFIRYVRLLHQAKQIRSGEAPDNFVAPGELSSFEKRHLRDAFQIVRSAQQTLLQSHPLGHVT
jgi:CBS domain-containing protein